MFPHTLSYTSCTRPEVNSVELLPLRHSLMGPLVDLKWPAEKRIQQDPAPASGSSSPVMKRTAVSAAVNSQLQPFMVSSSLVPRPRPLTEGVVWERD